MSKDFAPAADLTAANIREYLQSPENYDISAYDTVSSTNILLKEAAAGGAPEGSVIVASSQNQGRGRMGRSFFSPKDTGLYLSLLLRPDEKTSAYITSMAAVAVCRAIKNTLGIQAGIKWVNDIFVSEKKVCGILTEAVSQGGGICYAVLGVGVNVYQPEQGFPREIANTAGSLTILRQKNLRSRLAAGILDSFMELYRAGQNPADDYRKLCIVPGRRIDVIRQDFSRPALALDIDDACRLIVRYHNGQEEALSSGEISIRI